MVVTEDITALICTLSFLLICSHCVWDSEKQYSRFCLSVPYVCYIFYSYFTAMNAVHVKLWEVTFVKMWALHWDEDGQRLIHQEMNSSHAGECNEKQKPVQWIPPHALNLASEGTTCPGLSDGPRAKWLVELAGDFILKLTGRFDVPPLLQLIMNTPKLGLGIFFPITVVYNWIYNIKVFLPFFLFTFVSLIY